MSRNMGGFQHTAPLPDANTASTNTEITAVIDYFGDSEKLIRNLNASAQLREQSQCTLNVNH